MKLAFFVVWFFAVVSMCAALEYRGRAAEFQAKAAACEEKAQLADKVILTCLSQQTVVKWELQSLAALIRDLECK